MGPKNGPAPEKEGYLLVIRSGGIILEEQPTAQKVKARVEELVNDGKANIRVYRATPIPFHYICTLEDK